MQWANVPVRMFACRVGSHPDLPACGAEHAGLGAGHVETDLGPLNQLEPNC